MSDRRSPSPMDRRRFLALSGGAAVGAAAGAGVWAGLLRDRGATTPAPTLAATTSVPPAAAPRRLVLVELRGGNDVLNTLVPVLDGRYHDLRPVLALDEDEVVALRGEDAVGLHPALAPLAPLWDAGRLAAVPGVAYPQQTRSHFQAMDAWWSAQPDEVRSTGWLGRWLDESDDPTDPLRAVALGPRAPVLTGRRAASTVVSDPAGFTLRVGRDPAPEALIAALEATATPQSSDPLVAAAQRAVPDALLAVDALARATGSPSAAGTPPQASRTPITSLLDTAAGVLGLGIGTEVVVVTADGFDTHADQADRHASLLADLGGGLASLWSRLEADGLAAGTMVLVTSEFGRRVAENGSAGTDHGAGGLAWLLGPGVAGGVHGALDLADLVEGDLRPVVDPRQLYATALDWLGGDADAVLGGRVERVGAA